MGHTQTVARSIQYFMNMEPYQVENLTENRDILNEYTISLFLEIWIL